MRGYWWRPSQNRPPETEKETDVTTPIFIDHSQVGAYIDTLARFGAVGETGVRRLVYSPEWVAAGKHGKQKSCAMNLQNSGTMGCLLTA